MYSVMMRDSHTAPSQHTDMRTLILRGIRYRQTGAFSIMGESNYSEAWWWPDLRRTSSTCWFRTTCTADEICPTDLQHVIGLRLGPAENLSAILPREDLHLSLCESSLRPTLIGDRRVYWAEVTPLLQRWQSVNDTGCPHCHLVIRVNMSRHLRASHTNNQCFWRCPVSTCSMWFSSELNGKDHLERIHSFREGQGCSF